MRLEIACFNPESAVIASESGADRVELCDNAGVGGTTPPIQWLSQIEDKAKIPVNIMIRPRGGDFVFTDPELQSMRDAIQEFKSSDMISGFVFGVLTSDRRVDLERNTELVNLAAPYPCTFHRAFDETAGPLEALEDVIRCGFKTVLSSGGAANAVQGVEILAQLTEKAGDRIVIMPGGGVRSSNIDLLTVETGASFYHSSALIGTDRAPSQQEIRETIAKLQQRTR